jgi:hypothetical protein
VKVYFPLTFNNPYFCNLTLMYKTMDKPLEKFYYWYVRHNSYLLFYQKQSTSFGMSSDCPSILHFDLKDEETCNIIERNKLILEHKPKLGPLVNTSYRKILKCLPFVSYLEGHLLRIVDLETKSLTKYTKTPKPTLRWFGMKSFYCKIGVVHVLCYELLFLDFEIVMPCNLPSFGPLW